MPEVNWLAVIAAAVSSFVLGGLWYGPLFGKAWQKAAGVSDEQIKNTNMGVPFGGSFALALVQAAVFAMFLGPRPELGFAAGAGFAAGFAWVAAAFGVTYLFERRPMAHFLINGGYNTLAFTLFGVILGLWH